MLPPRLDYLFVAKFRDGSKLYQTPQDVSLLEPLTRSAFYDVAQRLAEVQEFTLTNGVKEHTVFLDDGHFNTDGRILVCPRSDLTNFRLIYFRTVQQKTTGEFRHYGEIVRYTIGWQANDANGKNYQMHIEIEPTGSLNAPTVALK
jgi:hypothetical protein